MGGLTAAEAAAGLLGIALIVRFLLRKAVPLATRSFSLASARRSEELRGEFVNLPPGRIAATLLLSGALCAGVVCILFRSVLVAAASGAVPILLSGIAIRWYRARRRRRILAQLPTFMDLLAGHVKAGHSLPESLSEAVPLLPLGIREEMSWVLQKCRLGESLAWALAEWERRMPSEEISLIVRPLRIAMPGGANLVDLLERTRDILVLRNRTVAKLRSMTAQARLQAAVLTLLPPVFTAVLSAIHPGFLSGLFGSFQGRTIVAVSATLQLLGWLAIRKILRVRS